MNWAAIVPVALLGGSNLVMNFAWYGHLKTPHKALWMAVLLSWSIAFFEYCLAVPANRIGAKIYTLNELKVIQEVLSLSTFVLIAWWLFGQRPGWNEMFGFALIATGAWFIFRGPFGS